LAKKRLVIVKNVEKFSSFDKELVSFLKSPVSKSVLILETSKKLTDRFIKKLTPHCTSICFEPLEGTELTHWITNYAQMQGKKITYNAAALLVEKIGNDLHALLNAVNQLSLYIKDEKEINDKDVDAIIKKTRQDTRFVFLNALMKKQTSRARTMAHELSRDGKNATDIIGLINWQLKRIENVKILAERGYSSEGIAKQLKMSPYALNMVRKQAGNFTRHQLDRDFQLLFESDTSIKQGLKSPGLTLQTLIVGLCISK